MKHIFLVVLFLVAIRPALADETNVYAIAKQQAEITGVDQEIGQTQEKISQLQTQSSAIDKEAYNISIESQHIKQQSHEHVASWNSACADRPVNTGNCAAQGAAVRAEVARVDATLPKMKQQFDNLHRKFQGIAQEIVLAQFRVQKLTNYKSQIEAAVARLKADLAGQCTGITPASSLEEMKNKCGNVQFDGTSATLPPCTTDRCREYDAMHR
jgi:chromosome segregation ATPase